MPNLCNGDVELPCDHKMGGRNLIICNDGTGNQFGYHNSNVVEMYRMVEKMTSDNQHTWYNSGIGTYARPHWKSLAYYKQVLAHWMDMAIAWNFEKTVQGAYRWLSDNYEDGDSIFLFGFSRGAFQVRVLAAMIDKVGLIHKGNEAQIPFAYELYADPRTSDGEPGPLTNAAGATIEGPKEMKCQAARFKAAFSREVQVHFVGVWDTVSSIGLARGKKTLPGTTDGMKHVCYFRQALALDERRVKFQPEYAYGGSATARPATQADGNQESKPSEDNANIPSTLKDIKPHTLEVWFAGTHSDIGGGNAYNAEMNRSRPPLRWMAHEAESLGLRIKKFDRDPTVDEQINFVESLTWFWSLFEIIPFQRLAFSRSPAAWGKTTYWPHLGGSRMVHEGQKIHSSLLFGKAAYTPKASLPTGSGLDSPDPWSQLREEGVAKQHGLLELDLIDSARMTLEAYTTEPDSGMGRMLERIVEHSAGAQVLYDEIIKDIERRSAGETADVDRHYRALDMAVKVLGPKAHTLTLRDGLDLHPALLGDKAQDKCIVSAATSFFRQLTSRCTLRLNGHQNWVRSVAFSPNGAHIVSSSSDQTARIWDAQSGDSLRELVGHTDEVFCAAISSDGTRIVSGSRDKSIRIWDAGTGDTLGQLEGHTDMVWSVAFSSDNTRVISGSWDKSIRIWDVQTGSLLKELEGHTERVKSASFSSDGTRIVSGSDDQTVRIWDAETGDLLRTLEGHTGWVQSAAFSSDGTSIVSSSGDKTVRVWDAQTGVLVRVLEGHTDTVVSAAFSSDGTRIVSGSDDKIVRVWDAQTGDSLRMLEGHTEGVYSAAFSSDGTCVVSGARDHSIRMWDVQD